MGIFDKILSKFKKGKTVTSSNTSYTYNTKNGVKDEDAYYSFFDGIDKRLNDQATLSEKELAIVREGTENVLNEFAKNQFKKNYNSYVENNNYADTFNQVMDHLFKQQCYNGLGLNLSVPYSGTSEKGVLAQINYDKLVKKYSSEIVSAMFIPYMQEVEKRCGSITYASDFLPKSIIDMYTTYKKATDEEKLPQLISGLIMLQCSGISNLKDSSVFPDIIDIDRQKVLKPETEKKINELREEIKIIDHLPEEFKKCIVSNTQMQTEQKKATVRPRNFLDSRPPDV